MWAPPKTKLHGERLIKMAPIQLRLEVTDMVPLVDRGLGWGEPLKR